MEVKIWTKSNCVQCEMTKKQFVKLGVKYTEHNLEENLDQLDEFKDQGLLAAPIIESEVGTWSGFQPNRISDLSQAIKAREGR